MTHSGRKSGTLQAFDDDLMKVIRFPRASEESGKRKLSFTLLDDSQMSSKSARIDSERHRMAKLGGEITVLKHKLHQESIAKRRSITLYEEEINSLAAQKQKSEKDAEEYKAKMSSCLTRMRELRQNLDDCEKVLTEAQNSADDKLYKLARSNIDRENELMEKIDSLEAQLNQTKGELLKEKLERAESDEKVTTLKREIEMKSKEVEEYHAYIKDKEEALKDMTHLRQKIQSLEDEISRNEEADAVVQAMKSKLEKFPRMEKENIQLADENKKLRDREANIYLLQDENRTLRRKVDLIVQTQTDLASAESEVEKLRNQLQSWEQCGSETDSKSVFRSPEELHRHLRELQRDNLQLNECRGRLQSSVAELESLYKDQKREMTRLARCHRENEERCQTLEVEVKRVNQRFKLVSQERDLIKKLLDEYEQDTTTAFKQDEGSRLASMDSLLRNYKSQVVEQDAIIQKLRKIESVKSNYATEKANISNIPSDTSIVSRSCEKLIADLRQRISELEEKLSDDADENTANKQRIAELEEKVSEDAKEHAACKQRLSELEETLKEVCEQKEVLEMRNEKRTLQGDYDPTNTKILHMKLNPEAIANRKRAEELGNLKSENEKLQRRILKLEEARAADETLEMSKLDDQQNAATLKEEVEELKSRLQSESLKAKRLIEMFKKKSMQLREACFCLLGHKLDIKESGEVKLTSSFADGPDEFLLFRAEEESDKDPDAPTSSGGRRWMLMETEYSVKLRKDIEHYIKTYGSIPALVCSVYLENFGRQTMLE